MFKRNNNQAKWHSYTLQADGSYTSGKKGRQWKIYNKEGKVDYTGTLSQCSHQSSKFSRSSKNKAEWTAVSGAAKEISSSSSFEKCGQSVQEDCVGTTIEMTEEGW